MTTRQDVISAQLQVIEWRDKFAYVHCPSEGQHTGKTSKRDCRVYHESVPTIHCVHASCRAAVEEANKVLRSTIGKCESNGQRPDPMLAHQRVARRTDAVLDAAIGLRQIRSADPVHLADLWEMSTVRLDGDPANEWRLILQWLYAPDDWIWMADDPRDAGGDRIHTVQDWLELEAAPGMFMSTATFQPAAPRRINEHIRTTPFHIVESDVLDTQDQLRLFPLVNPVAVVHSGRRSFHFWVHAGSVPDTLRAAQIDGKRVIDPQGFRGAPITRVPGAMRGDQMQLLHFLSP